MKRIIVILGVVLCALIGFFFYRTNFGTNSYARNLDLGKKYLLDGDYDDAISAFSDAIDRPYVLFGSIANKYLPRVQKHAELFTRCEGATDNDVKTAKMKYIGSGLQEPTFPEYFTNAQKIRYMYYHFGFLKIQKETGEIYPPEVLDSLAKLQALSTEPDPEKRISERVVEDVLLNLMVSIDQWKESGVYRIEGEKITPGSMTDEILPKNKSVNKENIQQNNKNRGNRIQDGIREIRLIRPEGDIRRSILRR